MVQVDFIKLDILYQAVIINVSTVGIQLWPRILNVEIYEEYKIWRRKAEAQREKRYKEFWSNSLLNTYVYHCKLPKGYALVNLILFTIQKSYENYDRSWGNTSMIITINPTREIFLEGNIINLLYKIYILTNNKHWKERKQLSETWRLMNGWTPSSFPARRESLRRHQRGQTKKR